MTTSGHSSAPGASLATPSGDLSLGDLGTALGDPKSIVTPDAFSVAPELLGTPLAAPWRRFAAIFLDLVLIGFLQLLGWRFVLGGAALILFLVLIRRPGGAKPSLLRRTVTGCAGALVLVVAVLATLIPTLIRNRDLVLTPDGASVAGPAVAPGPEAGRAAEGTETTGEDVPSLADSMLALLAAIADSAEAGADSAGEGRDDGSGGTAFDWIRDIADEAGLVFGWGTVYITLFLALWDGRTPGKRALDLRVVRITGGPLGLLMSFERAGGYAAGIATGLLGFARVWWDPNRQGIHDKIANTVVIRESLPKVPGLWNEAARRNIPATKTTQGNEPTEHEKR